ncbi:MAG TPA: ABC transporter permease [Clostridia bacterium]|nr:ABC transporter permease [Clostridia bacterium]
MINYTLKRIVSAIPTLLVVAVLIFFLIRMIPGNPAQIMLSEDATAEEVAAMEVKLGLDKPVIVQFGIWLADAARGDLGNSVYYNRPVLEIIGERLEPTMLLVVYAMVIAMLLGLLLGVIAAINRNRLADKLCMVLSIVGISMPGFWLGLNLVILLAVKNPILPSVGYVTVAEGGMSEALRYLTLPALALGLQRSASIARVTRSSMLDVLNNDYIRTARSKGLPERKVIYVHALKNAANQILTQAGISIAHLMGGSVVIEKLFNIPGIGRLAFDSISRRDYPTIQGHILFVAAVYVLVNLAIDLLYKVFDPRIKYD